MTIYTEEPEQKEEPIKRWCSRCRRRTEHTPHGFRTYNYRETCDICNEINYGEIY